MDIKASSFSFRFLLIAGLVIMGVYACSSFTDPYKPFVSKKPPVYPAKVDTVIVQAGIKKVSFKVPKPDDPIVSKLGIFWNSGTDSIMADYPANKDTLFISIDTLEGARDYSFDFYNFDNKGDKSLRLNRLVFIPSHPPTPVVLSKSLWSNAKLPTDTWAHYSHYAFNQMWDNNATRGGYSFETTAWNHKLPMWFTINLGQKARITTFKYYPQPHWLGEWPKVFQIWGSVKPKVDSKHPFNNSWVLLGTYTPTPPGSKDYTNPDTPYPENRVDLTIKNASSFPYVQYIRIKVLSKIGTDSYLDFGEFTFFGIPKNEK